ncbi:MAG: DUF4250 domain-containing protein [Oscillospiraceae bacterium]|jgi:hypothetical protein
MQLPHNPFILLSFVNTQLRDNFLNLDDFCISFQTSYGYLSEKIAPLGYEYNADKNQFVYTKQ